MKTFNEYYVKKYQSEIVDLLSDLVIESFLNLNEDSASIPFHATIENQVKDTIDAWIKRMCDSTSTGVYGHLSKVCSLMYSKPKKKIELINHVVNQVRERLDVSDIEDPDISDIKRLASKELNLVKQKGSGAGGSTRRGAAGAQRMALDFDVLDPKYRDDKGRPQYDTGSDLVGREKIWPKLARTPGNPRHDELKRLVPRIIKRYRKGIATGEKFLIRTIADEFGVSSAHIGNVLNREGEREKNPNMARTRGSD
jgi:glycosyltransferase involved in cell wall biosynthesis